MNSLLDKLTQIKPVSRIIYGRDKDKKPNDYCSWDEGRKHWIENDSHFRDRISEQIKSNKED